MKIRLNKVQKELNVGLSTIVEFLQKNNFEIEENPNAVVPEEGYNLLIKEFSTDKNLRIQSDKFTQERQNKEKPKSVSINGYTETQPKSDEKSAVKAEEQAEPKVQNEVSQENETKEQTVGSEFKIKVVNRIDLDALNQRSIPAAAKKKKDKHSKEKVQKPVAEPTPMKEVKQNAVSAPKVEEKPAEAPATEEVIALEEVSRKESAPSLTQVNEIKPKLNIVGQIDLSAINQSTRPKKKTKEEKRKEREEKDKQREEQRKQAKENAGKNQGENAEKKKKRARIGNQRVNIDSMQETKNNQEQSSGWQGGGKNQGGKDSNASKGSRKDRDRQHKRYDKSEVNDEDVSKQIKETLERLTNRGKGKAAKYRKEKRELAAERQQQMENDEMQQSKVLKLTEFVTANELASMMNISVTQVIATCMSIGIMVSINQRLDAETINLVAEEFGFTTEYVSAEVAHAIDEGEDEEENLVPRAPIITVMGHVDHGKTSLLDYIRKSNVIAGEAGGITQHIGAYNVKMENGKRITFLDTPGHEAFTAMRARGAKITDIAIIIIAADDNVMPQTKEAINHAMAAGVPIVFAINKVDKPSADPNRIKEELANMNLLVEDWGGKYQSQDISAKKGMGVSELMEKVLLEAELLELKANPERKAVGSVIESTLDKGRGYVATVLVQNGTLNVGDIVVAGTQWGKVKAIFNERNQRIKQVRPAEPALILGLNGAPAAGDTFNIVDSEREAREITGKREQLQREQGLRTQKMLTLDEVGRRIALGNFQTLNIIVKGDVDGSIEALSDSLIKLSTETIQVNVIHKAVGQISESDVSLAAASDAIIVGFQVRPSVTARKLAEQDGVDIRLYSIIYDAIEEVKAAMEGMLAPVLKEEVTATIEVRETFHISKVGTVAGCLVREGKVKRTDRARLIRDGIVIFTGGLAALKRFKDDVKEVNVNYECGISLNGNDDIKVGDIIETFVEIEVKQKL
ncbi:MAG: translation initiation factor IF-2 [Bacteroidaceae bacterium]|nr:translation initiation factor IF-2 [Bacteroidaceae bacterium]